MRKLILFLILLTALVYLPSAFAETLMVAVDNVTVHDAPELYSDVRFQLYRGMEITPEKRSQQGSVTWVRFDIRDHKFWAVEKQDNTTEPLLSRKVEIDFCTGSDKKIVVNKKLRTLTVFNRNDSGWDAAKTYTIGLGKGTGLRAETRTITRPYAYLTLKGNRKFDLFESTGNALNAALGGEAVIVLDKAANTLALYHLKHGKLDDEEPQMYSCGEKIIAGDYVVEFAEDKFNLIINKDLYTKSKKFDRQTPEGVYYIARKNPVSRFGLDPQTNSALPSLQLSYPNSFDAWDGLRYGLISIEQYKRITAATLHMKLPPQDTPLGNLIMIHGGGNDDWTAGCIALEDEDMKELLNRVGPHTCVEIK
ncbi:MAG: L,D-transpeptidase [Nitrospirae bacterium]|nr:L,D-transpeptidase [Nitrospirota bacterium]